MAERIENHQLQELSNKNETSKRVEDAKGKSPQPITQGPEPTSSSGSRPGGSIPGLGSVVGGVARGMARGVGGVVGAMGSVADLMTGTTWEEDAEQHENEQISNRIEQQSNRKQREKRYMLDVHEHLDEVRQQQEHDLPVIPPMPFKSAASSSSYGSAPSSPAPTQFHIGDSAPATPAPTIKSSPLSVRSSPNAVQSSPQVVQSSPEAIRSSSSVEGPFGARSSSQSRARTEGEIRTERITKRLGLGI